MFERVYGRLTWPHTPTFFSSVAGYLSTLSHLNMTGRKGLGNWNLSSTAHETGLIRRDGE